VNIRGSEPSWPQKFDYNTLPTNSAIGKQNQNVYTFSAQSLTLPDDTRMTAHCSKRVQLESTASMPTPLTLNWRLSKGYWKIVYTGLCDKYDHLGSVFWHGGLLLYTSCFNFLVCPAYNDDITSAYNDVTETMKGASDRTDVAYFYVLGLQNDY